MESWVDLYGQWTLWILFSHPKTSLFLPRFFPCLPGQIPLNINEQYWTAMKRCFLLAWHIEIRALQWNVHRWCGAYALKKLKWWQETGTSTLLERKAVVDGTCRLSECAMYAVRPSLKHINFPLSSSPKGEWLKILSLLSKTSMFA